ncbi:MaoC-like domain-containing protein [Chloropicon primus]|uniref:MaoC-like domain-containing protein n=2 Tax=Chloropicon primus TaxID=1764295 RepID=A0A5B8MPZ5_9CHLO|nr:hypothetical protein A3770_08p52660 [Chloropicon primus]UPR01972.1 MaoC-like domain-containing protein [Chloropicon primus]|eukprot:QDZ22748.1 hypothetical protein A3770_08p52660 [Chloropicon primus]
MAMAMAMATRCSRSVCTAMASSTASMSCTSRDIVAIGDAYVKEASFTPEDVKQFVHLTGDENPIHQKAVALVPGWLTASIFPSIIGSEFPGSLYLEQSVRFKKKIYVGEGLTAKLVVKRVQGRQAVFDTQCFHDDTGEVVVEGEARALLKQGKGGKQ